MVRSPRRFRGALWLLVADAPRRPQGYAPANMTASQLFERNRHAVGTLEAARIASSSEQLLDARRRVDGRNPDRWHDSARTCATATLVSRSASIRASNGSRTERTRHANDRGLCRGRSCSRVDAQPQNPASGVSCSGVSSDASSHLVVEVTPSSGFVERRYYDAQTYLVTARDDRLRRSQANVQYGDYRSVAGRSIAYAIGYERDGELVTQTKVSPTSACGNPGAFAPRFRSLVRFRQSRSGRYSGSLHRQRDRRRRVDQGARPRLHPRLGLVRSADRPQVARELGIVLTGALRVSFGGDFTMASALLADFTVGA